MNLVEMIGKYVPADMLPKIGSAAGLGADDTKKVASGAVPLVAAGLAQVGSTEEGAGRLLDLARQTGAEDMVDRFGDILGSEESRRTLVERGGGIVSSLFGAKTDSILDAFTGQTGASKSGTRSFLAMLAPLALGVLGRQAHSQGLGVRGLASMLAGQSGLLANMLPGGVLGGEMSGREERESWRAEAERPREVPSQLRTSEPIRRAEREAPRRKIGIPAIALAIGLAFVAWALLRQKPPDVERQARTSAPTATPPSEVTPGMRQAAPRQGIDALASYSGGNLEGKRFTFEEIVLDTGTGKLARQSAQQVDRLAGVMKERGGMKVRLEGERASPVRDALAASGIAVERVTIAEPRPGKPADPAALRPGQVDVVVVEQ